jgi:ATP-dependent protease ClpP protease subunit
MFALIDVMKNSYHNISTIGIGAVMSAGFLIFASGKEGQRYIGKNAGSMNHQHSDNMDAKMHDIKAQMKENQNCETRCMQILRDATGMTIQEVRNKFIKNPSDQYYTAKQMVDLNIADHIL